MSKDIFKEDLTEESVNENSNDVCETSTDDDIVNSIISEITESKIETSEEDYTVNESEEMHADEIVTEDVGIAAQPDDSAVEEVVVEETAEPKMKVKKVKKPLMQRISFRIFASVMTFLVLVVGTLYGVMAVISYGPSPTARDLLINSLLETSAAKFVANIYFSDEEIETIQSANKVEQTHTETNTDLIKIPDENDTAEEVEALIVEEVKGDTFKGKMMIIADPTRVFVGSSAEQYSSSQRGKKVEEIIASYGAVGGTNAGGFSDPGGVGNGGIPLGIVISQGELLWGNLATTYDVIGIDTDNKLIVGSMTAQEALDKNIRDAVSFGPVLISNGEVMEVSGSGGGLNPRTAIGQRADGAMLLLVCDGRQSNSLGASMSDVIDVMIDYGAVNAANLDGGSSTVMYHNDELINVCASLYGPRDMPTAIVVGPEIVEGDANND